MKTFSNLFLNTWQMVNKSCPKEAKYDKFRKLYAKYELWKKIIIRTEVVEVSTISAWWRNFVDLHVLEQMWKKTFCVIIRKIFQKIGRFNPMSEFTTANKATQWPSANSIITFGRYFGELKSTLLIDLTTMKWTHIIFSSQTYEQVNSTD